MSSHRNRFALLGDDEKPAFDDVADPDVGFDSDAEVEEPADKLLDAPDDDDPCDDALFCS